MFWRKKILEKKRENNLESLEEMNNEFTWEFLFNIIIMLLPN